ncbi:cytochrome c oxidase subunit 4 [Actinacidiphila bryophytorum]|uniref:cytochrome c oxidase subunit 4 n=1 Tax=Actinacidiphila bryophytorum TaxID=1436133 RepID=UPI002176DFDD|nr:cytochrome c oxidase subunit 4 [Actinacidiphila bryophytorum]UWE10446.1 cytochrome c oxidase subunit 4 [Actinacidiphila bryophytorum]
MKTEAYLFGGVAVFFLGTTLGYALTSGPEPAGTAALAVAFLMSSLVCFFFAQNYRRRGLRPEDDRQGEVLDRRGPVDFFPPDSPYPVVAGLGAALSALGIVYGLWLFLIGFGIIAAGVGGLVFQYVHRGE